jgi:hypothetical protein
MWSPDLDVHVTDHLPEKFPKIFVSDHVIKLWTLHLIFLLHLIYRVVTRITWYCLALENIRWFPSIRRHFQHSVMWNSYSSSQSGGLPNVAGIQDLSLGYSQEEIERLRVQNVGEGEVKIRLFSSISDVVSIFHFLENVCWYYSSIIVYCRLYEGRVVQGPLKGIETVFKV